MSDGPCLPVPIYIWGAKTLIARALRLRGLGRRVTLPHCFLGGGDPECQCLKFCPSCLELVIFPEDKLLHQGLHHGLILTAVFWGPAGEEAGEAVPWCTAGLQYGSHPRWACHLCTWGFLPLPLRRTRLPSSPRQMLGGEKVSENTQGRPSPGAVPGVPPHGVFSNQTKRAVWGGNPLGKWKQGNGKDSKRGNTVRHLPFLIRALRALFLWCPQTPLHCFSYSFSVSLCLCITPLSSHGKP